MRIDRAITSMTKQQSEYIQKPDGYFSGARKIFVDALPQNSDAKLLEIGCGNGDTAAYALATGKCGWCAGVELCPAQATIAAKHLQEVQVGDVELIALPYPSEHFDILIMSEILEHLRDPWSVLRQLHELLKPGAWVLAGSPMWLTILF
jgi:SAM-dependent methyltransferase